MVYAIPLLPTLLMFLALLSPVAVWLCDVRTSALSCAASPERLEACAAMGALSARMPAAAPSPRMSRFVWRPISFLLCALGRNEFPPLSDRLAVTVASGQGPDYPSLQRAARGGQLPTRGANVAPWAAGLAAGNVAGLGGLVWCKLRPVW